MQTIDKNQAWLKPTLSMAFTNYKIFAFQMLIEIIRLQFEKSTRNRCISFA